MSIYKPTNCHPFATAVDITKSFMRLEYTDGDWKFAQPPGAYVTCKIESSNTQVIGYRVKLYENDRLIFSGEKVSPVSELPRFNDDPSINTGVNGSYLAIPLFQSDKWYNGEEVVNYRITDSYNAIYSTGYYSNHTSLYTNTSGLISDYILIDSRFHVHGETIEPDPEDDLDNWTYESMPLPGGGSRRGYVPNYDTGDSLTINGGNVVKGDDTVLLSFSDSTERMVLCVLGDGKINGKPYLSIEKDVLVYESAPLYVKKGKYCGFYNRAIGDVTEAIWYEAFRTIDGAPVPSGSLVAEDWGMDVENDTFSWEIELYQGPEKYDDLVILDQTTKAEYVDVDKLQRGQYDMVVASGTILGSCSKRLHLRSMVMVGDKYRLPGYGMSTPPVLINSFCEISNNYGTLIPSFQISAFDSSLGIVYPKDGGLNASSLSEYGPTYAADGTISSYSKAVFYKYSSNSTDLLSNETVRVCAGSNYSSYDPRTWLVPGAIVDNVTLNAGDRVLWNNSFGDGFYNGIWVVPNGEEGASRPADGNDWADYIGKVTLVTEGTFFAGVVMESTAEAGSYELGNNSLFFRKQMPIQIFDGSIVGSDVASIDELNVDINLMSYITFTIPPGSQVITIDRLPLPVLGDTRSLGAHRGVFRLDGENRPYGVKLDEQTSGGGPGDGYDWVLIGYYQIGSSTKSVYAIGKNATDVTYKVEHGLYQRTFWDFKKRWVTSDFVYYWEENPKVYYADLLFNDSKHTYLSPSSAISENMYLKLRSGTVALYDDYRESSYLKILSYDNVFNCITHERLSSPLVAETNQSVSPSTPYKYDIVSCYRTSDANGFTFAPLLAPTFAPQTAEAVTPILASSSVVLRADVYAPIGENWREGRWILNRSEGSNFFQDTGWFQKGVTDCRFIGLNNGDTYRASLYVKDDWGRIAQTSIAVESDEDEVVSRYNLVPYPGTLKATPDCSTQSVLLEYIPENEDYSDWPNSIPDGSYDIYRREYADFSIEGCPYYEGGIPHDEGLWYGDWQPVAIGVKTTTIRDFNVKQGHSYQYAILPRAFSVSEVEFKYLMLTDGEGEWEVRYDDMEDVDGLLPKNAPLFYRVGYKPNGVPYLFAVDREDDTSIPDPFSGDVFLYDGTYELNGTLYDHWLGQDKPGSSNSNASVLTNRVVPFGLPHYGDILANDGNPVYVQWSDWSIVELNVINPDTLFSNQERCPAIKKAYKADINNIWLFKYDVEEGTQTINIAKSEFNSMGEFPRFFSGELNSESGEVSCWLGSEIAKGSIIGYVERRRRSIFAPLSTNEAAAMLADWRKIIKSDKPKLLRDRKGRSWIVQISGGSSSTMGTYPGRPTKISFSWKQIGDPSDATVIYGDGDELDKTGQSGVWKPRIIKSS